jgi:eukaryotic-like serine/threonine-protein kinase
VNDSQIETAPIVQGATPEALQRWGPFENLRRVGRGSFGEVYHAFDPTLQRHVALKLLLPSRLNRRDESDAVLREARAMARVRHPNVVPIHGVGEYEGRVGFWTDFIQGQTLSEIVAANGPMGAREAALATIDVCRAVGAVHAAGLVHRDIKAGNVMRESGGRIVLMDFGLSHAHGAEDAPSGTPLYMAPELLEGEPATTASDVYAIGVLLFNLLTATYPIDAPDRHALRSAHRAGTRRTLLDVRPDLPEALAAVVEAAIHPLPEKRFATTGRMALTLAEALGLGSVGLAGPPPSSSSRRAKGRALVAGGAVIIATLLLLTWVRPMWTISPAATEAPVYAAQEDYRRAHELLAHYYRPGALESAVPMLEQVVARDPQFAPAHADLARANLLQFIQQRDPKYIEPARTAALRAVALAPGLASPHVTLATLYARTSQNELASHEIEEALRLDRFNASAYGALADLYFRQGRTEQVEPTLRKAVSLAPDDWSLVQQLGEFYLNSGKWEEAGEQYRRAAELVPDNPRAHNNLGLVYRGMDRLDDAAEAFRRAIALEPTFLRYRNLGMVLAEAGRYSEAVPMLQRAIEMRPDHYRAWGLLGLVYLNEGRDAAEVRTTLQKAIGLAADLLKETPRDEHLLADVGTYYAALGNEDESLPRLRQAEALAPHVPEVLYQVAVGYEMLRRRDEALKLLAMATAAGYPRSAIAREPQLARMRDDPGYAALLR